MKTVYGIVMEKPEHNELVQRLLFDGDIGWSVNNDKVYGNLKIICINGKYLDASYNKDVITWLNGWKYYDRKLFTSSEFLNDPSIIPQYSPTVKINGERYKMDYITKLIKQDKQNKQ